MYREIFVFRLMDKRWMLVSQNVELNNIMNKEMNQIVN